MRNFALGVSLVALMASCPAFADEIRGTLMRVSPEKQEIAVDVRERGRRSTAVTLHLDADTQVMLGRKAGKISDLAVGKRVRVFFEDQNGQHMARSIIAPPVINLNPALLKTLANIGAANGINLGNLGLGAMKNPPAPGAPPIPAAANGNGIGGILRRVSRTDRELVILGDPSPGKPPSETTVFVPNEAQITRDQRTIGIDDLKEGEAVVVFAQSKNGRLEAQSVSIGQPPVAAAPGAPVPAPVPAPAMQGDNKIARIREALRLLDGILEQFDQQRNPQRP